MSYSPKEAWENAARLLALCLGFNKDQRRRMSKVSQKYNDDTGYHEISLKLEVHHTMLYNGMRILDESANDSDNSLLQEINNRIIDP